MDNRNIEEITESYITEFNEFWGDKVSDFVSSDSTDVPYKMLNLEFTLYNYSLVRLTLERNTVWLSDVSKGICLKLLGNSIPSNGVGRHLPQIDNEIRLRIPDKYLEAKRW
jgi:hypothetical protein